MSYEAMRDREKRLTSQGYQEPLLRKGRKYGKLIKIFATRSEAAEFRRRPSLFGPGK